MATKKKSKKKLPPNVEIIRPEDIPKRKRAEARRKADIFGKTGIGGLLRRKRIEKDLGDPRGGDRSRMKKKAPLRGVVNKKKKKK